MYYIQQYYWCDCTETIGWERNRAGWWHHCFSAELLYWGN